ncbi:dethiobiotin synthase [Nocardioides panacihumi]|uniref:ATP-dependent dethiobiotin synthetase BioD n=1 Tax=Nocardioides panacihumi TaxID=400774 RepID=A0ABP5D7K2_9ACTN
MNSGAGRAGQVLIVTGTTTGIGKTVVTAALVAQALGRGERVTMVKPTQTGVADGDSDADEVHRLTGVETHELTRLDEPLAPDTAARRAGVTIPPVATYADPIRVLTQTHDLVVVEGAGGLLVRLDTDGGTLLDLADALCGHEIDVAFVVVTAPGLGTLNHTELTVNALRARGFEPAGLVVGAWPTDPGVAERCNRDDLPRVTGVPLLGVAPEGVGTLDRAEFLAMLSAHDDRDWFAPTGS